MDFEQKKLLITGLVVLFVAVVGSIFIMRENYNQVMTLGNFGKPEPASCYESEPEVRFKNLYICNACSLGCSSKESWDKCDQCQRNLSARVVGVM